MRMMVLPSLTSTKKDRIPAFVRALAASSVRHIALFPTCLTISERQALYNELEAIRGLRIPHVHLRSDYFLDELLYLEQRMGTEVFNIHPKNSSHPFGRIPEKFATRIYIENTDTLPCDEELQSSGICIDFSHMENARRQGKDKYIETFLRQLERFPVGCCHISALRSEPNAWKRGFDYHEYVSLSEFDYMSAYTKYMPTVWASMELENTLGEQLEAIEYLTKRVLEPL